MTDTMPSQGTHLAIPIPSGSGSRRPLPLRAIRSTGSLRTPQSSLEPIALDKSLSASPPELSYSNSSAHTSHDPEYHLSGTASTSKLDSWRSAYSHHSGEGGPISAKRAGKQRIRLDSVFGTQLPGFPYNNSAAVATAGPALQNRSSRTWSDRSASGASGSYAGRSGRTRSDTLGNYSSTSNTSYGAPIAAASEKGKAAVGELGEVDTSCSGGSNSSDEVDLDLSFDMDLLRAKQLAVRQKQAARAPAAALDSGLSAGHIGIDMQEGGYAADEESGLPSQAGMQSSEEYRRYRLAGKKHLSRSAVELRPADSGQRYSGRSEPGKLATSVTATSWARQPGLDLSDIPPAHPDEPIGWSFATTPPLSPAEAVMFAELNSQSSRFMSRLRSDSSSGLKERRRSFGASELLRKRRPSFPLMSLLSSAMHRPQQGEQRNSPPAAGGTARAGQDEDLTIASFCNANADASPTPTQQYNIRYQDAFASEDSLPPVPVMPAAYADSARSSSVDSPVLSPGMLSSSPGTMTADYTPETSAWNSPRSQDEDLPTPKTGDFAHVHGDERFSQYSMAPVAVAPAADIRDSLQASLNADAQEKRSSKRESDTYKPTHARQSSSIFRFPFVSNLFNNAFRPISPATTVVPIPEDSGENTPTGPGAPSEQSTSARAASPASADSHGALSSEGSHAQSSDPPSPPRDGAKPSRLSGVIDNSMLRPGPNTGKGRLAGLGLSFGAGGETTSGQRQSSLPVLAFSTASSDGHGSASQESHGSGNSSGSLAARSAVVTAPVQELEVGQYTRPRSSLDSPRIAVLLSSIDRRAPMSAPATTIRFSEAVPDLASRVDISVPDGPRTASPRLQHQTLPAVRRPRRVLPRPSDFDLRGRIDRIKPAQALFVAAFLLGPWCFVLGGWGLRYADGEYASIKGTQCRCPEADEVCTCQAEIYRSARLAGGKKPQEAQMKIDRFVMANRIGALVTGTGSAVLAITALIALGRAW